MITLHRNQHSNNQRRFGFTLVELLVVIAVIGILVGMLTVGVQRVLVRTREFQVQNEMNQMESAIERFKIKFGFYPPGFKEMEDLAFVDNDPEEAANLLMTYINRIAPNNIEGAGIYPDRPVDIWWRDVGSKRLDQDGMAPDTSGSELVFWLNGISRNKQRPLTSIDTMGNVVANVAHSFNLNENIEREDFYEFDQGQIQLIPDGTGGPEPWAQYVQPAGREVRYLYLDSPNYLPSRLNSGDGAYVRNGFDQVAYEMIRDRMLGIGSPLFKQMYPNSDSYQLITFGLDGEPGVVSSPNPEHVEQNVYALAGPQGADNMVNFISSGPGKLEILITEEN